VSRERLCRAAYSHFQGPILSSRIRAAALPGKYTAAEIGHVALPSCQAGWTAWLIWGDCGRNLDYGEAPRFQELFLRCEPRRIGENQQARFAGPL
jgi:hypothetical protein